MGKPLASISHISPHLPARSLDLGASNFGAQSGFVGEMYGATDLLRSVTGPTEVDKPVIVEAAVSAMEELMRVAQAGEPLWIPGENNTEVLNEEEYLRTFPRGIGPTPLGTRSEASRESAVVIMNHVSLVEILMDVVGFLLLFGAIILTYQQFSVLLTNSCLNITFRINGQRCFVELYQEQ